MVLETLGWIGSALVVASLMLANVWRFRVLNLIGSLIATGYNVALGIWPFVAMNAAIAVVNIYWLVRLRRAQHEQPAYSLLEVGPENPYVTHLLQVRAAELRRAQPSFDPNAFVAGRSIFLTMAGEETIGLVAVRDDGRGVAYVELDVAMPRFRDLNPGAFVYSRGGPVAVRGFYRVVVSGAAGRPPGYFEKLGFERKGVDWVLDVTATPAVELSRT
ncbi:hypothetical protein [Cellulomonas fimi]|uniref:YgjV family protein n=1 Tax=Cellulomonas fimi TaxID=1708 RepID=A0A7Y0QGI2_CELFI|nr:hypothetical protein [Cellulomonas fimi]NMR19260.1 YgjV family protein [Cellulomonas fimi]